jgi:hypothetical protein
MVSSRINAARASIIPGRNDRSPNGDMSFQI